MSEQTLSTVQVLGAFLPATGLLGLLIYARCRSAGCSSRRTAVTVASVCGAVLVSAATLLVAREALSGGLFDLGLHMGEDGQPICRPQTCARAPGRHPSSPSCVDGHRPITIRAVGIAMRRVRATHDACHGRAPAVTQKVDTFRARAARARRETRG